MRTHNGRDFFINKLLYKKSRKNKALILFDYSYYNKNAKLLLGAIY
jgi:hypothetical protein